MEATIRSRPHALVVDDDPDVRDALRDALAVRGATVATAATRCEASRRLTERGFELVVTDLRLETDLDGLDVVRIARHRAPRARVVLISGSDLESVAGEAAAAGVDQMLSKPLSSAALDRLLDDLECGPSSAGAGLDDDQARALLDRWNAGDAAAFDRLAEAYRPMLFAVFLRWFRLHEADAEDLYQEVLMQLVRKAAEIRDVRRWLLGTAVNQSKKRIRFLVRQRTLVERWGEERELETPAEEPDIRELLDRAMARLKPGDRELLRLIYLEERSYQETADILGRPIGSIGPLRGRALKRLLTAVTELETPPVGARAA